MYDTLLSIQPRVATSKDADVKSPEEIVDDLAAVFEEECPADFPHDQAGFGKDQHAHSLFILQPNGWLCCCVAVGVCVSRAHARMSALALRDHFARLSRLVLVGAVVQS
jgi:hypothetical protein